jgi:hypothetical protein
MYSKSPNLPQFQQVSRGHGPPLSGLSPNKKTAKKEELQIVPNCEPTKEGNLSYVLYSKSPLLPTLQQSAEATPLWSL